MRRVKAEEVERWQRQYEERKLSIPAIAKMANRNHHVVYYHLLRCGTKIRSGQIGAEVTATEVGDWMQQYLQGTDPEDFTSCTRTIQTIYKHLARGLKKQLEELLKNQ